MKHFILAAAIAILIAISDQSTINYTDTIDGRGYIIRQYYDPSGEIIGESFGYEIDDYLVDYDHDGRKELVCNCVYGGDCCRRVYVYKQFRNKYYCGSFTVSDDTFPGLDYWGNNAIAIYYDRVLERFKAEYYSQLNKENITVLLSVDDLEYNVTNVPNLSHSNFYNKDRKLKGE